MYKFFVSLFVSFVIVLSAFAQKSNDNKSHGVRLRDDRGACPKAYLGLNFGVNNPNGIVGISADVPIIEHLSVGAGIGRSSWGWKYFGEVRGYLSQCHRKWAAGVGISHNTGLTDFKTDIETTRGEKQVTLDLEPQTNGFINLYHFFNIGKKRNRFYLMLGYSAPLTGKHYKVKSNDILTEDSKKAMDILGPGGISIGFGFYFKLSSAQ